MQHHIHRSTVRVVLILLAGVAFPRDVVATVPARAVGVEVTQLEVPRALRRWLAPEPLEGERARRVGGRCCLPEFGQHVRGGPRRLVTRGLRQAQRPRPVVVAVRRARRPVAAARRQTARSTRCVIAPAGLERTRARGHALAPHVVERAGLVRRWDGRQDVLLDRRGKQFQQRRVVEVVGGWRGRAGPAGRLRQRALEFQHPGTQLAVFRRPRPALLLLLLLLQRRRRGFIGGLCGHRADYYQRNHEEEAEETHGHFALGGRRRLDDLFF